MLKVKLLTSMTAPNQSPNITVILCLLSNTDKINTYCTYQYFQFTQSIWLIIDNSVHVALKLID